MNSVTLITGGSRSGKSRRALELAEEYSDRAFIATARASDAEMRERIEQHKRERGDAFITREEDRDLAGAVRGLPEGTEVAVIDCLTLWLANLLNVHGAEAAEFPEIDEFLRMLEGPPCDLIVVTNEVGQGIVPANRLARRFRDLAGRVNQHVARRADRVILMVCGIPTIVR